MREFENRVFQDKTIGKKFMDNYLKKVGSAPIRIIIIIILEFQGRPYGPFIVELRVPSRPVRKTWGPVLSEKPENLKTQKPENPKT